MSAYVTYPTPMTDRECLLAALAEVGFDASKVEVHDTPVRLVGYEGVRRAEVAEIVIRKRYVGGMSNDIGFLKEPTGYRAIISDYDLRTYNEAWMKQLRARYDVHWAAKQERLAAEERKRLEEERRRLVEAQRAAVRARAKELGYQVQETQQGERIRMVLVKRVY